MSEQIVPIAHDVELLDWPLQHHEGTVKVVNTAEKYEVCLEVPGFLPKEIQVKVAGGDLVIDCRHEPTGKDDDWIIAREIHRAYKLPEGVDDKEIKSAFTPEGQLKITAAKKH